MIMDVLHTEHVGGGPGFVLLRLSGHASAPAVQRLAPPTLLIDDGASWKRLATVPGTAPIEAGPQATRFAVEFELPLHLVVAGGAWWLEPGPPIDGDGRLAQLVSRVASLRAEVAALRARVEARDGAIPAPARPTPLPSGQGQRRRSRRRIPRPSLPMLLVASGALVVADAATTVVWQEPVSALWAGHQQHELQADFARLDSTFATRARAAAVAPVQPASRMRALATILERTVKPGRPLGRLRIARIEATYVVVQGTGAGSLRRGPGHYLGTPLPGQPGTVGLAGHRTMYGAPFRHLDALRRGDALEVTMPYGRFTYRVDGLRIVRPEDVSSLQSDGGRQRLVLTACHPLYSASRRLVVLASLQRATPRGVAARPRPTGVGAGAAPSQPA